MKKNFRKKLISVACLACMATLAFGVGMNAVSANAAEEAEVVTTTNNFYMTDGAAIRIKSGTPSGIRWSVTVTESYYNYVTSLGEVQWGMVVDNVAIEEDSTSTTQVNIPLKNQKLPTFNADDEVEETWTYYASITYDELVDDMTKAGYKEDQISEKLTQAYKTLLYARAYNTVNGTTTLAVDADTGRSIKGVATYCLIENTADVTAGNKSTFETYAGGAYTVAEEQEFNNFNAYDLLEKSGAFTAELTDGTYDVYFGAKYLGEVTATDGKVSLTATGFGKTFVKAGEMGELRFINAENEVTEVPFISATHAISTKAELTAFLTSYSGLTTADTNDSENYYAVLTKDINYEDAAMPGRAYNAARFGGTFNGMGYAIKNYRVADTGGIFGSIATGCLIENVAFINGIGRSQNAPLVAGQTYGGTVKNVYVKGSYTVANGYRGMFYAGGLGVASNCIVDIDYPAETTAATTYVFVGANGGNLANSMYGIGNATQLEPQTKTKPYADGVTFFNAEKANLTTENGWSKYWTVSSEYGLFFGAEHIINTLKKQTIAQYTFDEATKKYTKNDTFTVGGKTLNFSDYTLGETYSVDVNVDGKTIEQPFTLVSHAIGTKDELTAFLTSYSGLPTADTNDSENYYAVLTKDINYEDAAMPGRAYNAARFGGTFNGMGYAIKNYRVADTGGIFGSIATGCLIENVAFINGIGRSQNAPLVAGQTYGGTVKNVYVKGSYTVANGYRGMFYAGGLGVASNCIVDIDYPANTTAATTYVFTGGTNGGLKADTMFGIGNAKQLEYKTATAPYATVAAMLAEKKTSIVSANGWSEYWSFDGSGNLYFGDEQVAD